MVRKAVEFNNPPVVEVVCGVLFSNSEQIKTAHIGAFWQVIKDEFPRIEDAPPLDPQVEANEEFNLVSQTIVSFGNLPPIRRAWFISEDGRNLIQIQGDRFIFNWKRAKEEDTYPRYTNVKVKFEKYLKKFKDFCKDAGLGDLEYRQFELIYVNHITKNNGLNLLKKESLFIDHKRLDDNRRFLPPPASINWNSSYTLPKGYGRLHVTMQTALAYSQSIEEIVRMDLTARGIPREISSETIEDWFETAHEWIIKGFADLTSNELHAKNNWDRTT